MAKFGIISDLHLDHSGYDFHEEPGIFYLNAGDVCEDIDFRTLYLNSHPNMFSVLGNHDYYNDVFPNPFMGIPYPVEHKGVKIVGATLWTDLSNYLHWTDYVSGLIDFRKIKYMSYDNYNNAHQMHKKYLMESEADIIVSHHAPSSLSIHPKYKGSFFNPAFANEMTEEILNMKKPPKLWIHGHVHDSFDYMIGETRVICNPRGYPNESNFNNYEPKIVEL